MNGDISSSNQANDARLFGGTLNARGQALFRFVLRDGASISITLDREELVKLQSAATSLLSGLDTGRGGGKSKA